MKHIVITGATSMIGVHLMNQWLDHDCVIYAVIRPNSTNSSRIPADQKIKVINCSMDMYDSLPDIIPQADYFYHLAWDGTRASARNDPALQNQNYVCAVKAMNAAKTLGCSFFLGSGSQAEYGKMTDYINEEHECAPITAYGKEKLHSCNTLGTMADDYGIRFVWTRIFSLYGQYDNPGNFVSTCLDRMCKNETIDMTMCTQMWDYLYAGDAVRAMVDFACNSHGKGVYNLASGNVRPLKEYVEDMLLVTQSHSKINFGSIPYGPDGPVDLLPDISRIKNELGWRAEMPFKEGIDEIIKNGH